MKQKIHRQNLIYNLLVFDNSGQLLRAIDQPVTSTFFKSMTFNVLRVGENSKMSLLQKNCEASPRRLITESDVDSQCVLPSPHCRCWEELWSLVES